MSYRKDKRSDEQFKKDIEKFSSLEEKYIAAFADLIGQKYYRYGFREGELSDDEVNTKADFWVDSIGLVEVKTCRRFPEYFHLKVSQINSYVKQAASILMILDTDNPKYALIKPDQLTKYEQVNFFPYGGKLSYKIPTGDFEWQKM